MSDPRTRRERPSIDMATGEPMPPHPFGTDNVVVMPDGSMRRHPGTTMIYGCLVLEEDAPMPNWDEISYLEGLLL